MIRVVEDFSPRIRIMQFARAVAITKCPTRRNARSLRVFLDTSNVVRWSNISWRGRSFAASIPSDSSKHQRSVKRISKQERRTMVESFVNRYRASNAGRFPSPSFTRKELGGSFYVIKQIIQKLEYECKSSNTREMTKLLLDSKEEPESLIRDQKISTAGEIIDQHFDVKKDPQVISSSLRLNSVSHEPKLEIKKNSGIKVTKVKTEQVIIKNVVAKEEPIGGLPLSDLQLPKEGIEFGLDQRFSNDKDPKDFGGDGNSVVSVGKASRSREQTVVSSKNSQNSLDQHSVRDQIHSHQDNLESEAEVLFPPHAEPDGSKIDAIAAKGIRKSAQPETQSVQNDRESLQTEDSHRDLPKKLEHEESSTPKRNVWGNLKAIADGFINFWKKL